MEGNLRRGSEESGQSLIKERIFIVSREIKVIKVMIFTKIREKIWITFSVTLFQIW